MSGNARKVSQNERDLIVREFRDLKRRIGRLENNHSPTVPIYDPDYPSDAVAGQIALSTERPADDGEPEMLPYYRDRVGWHPLGTKMQGKSFMYVNSGGNADITEGDSEPFDPFTFGIDITGIFEPVTSPFFGRTGIKILAPGLYFVRSQCYWGTSFGTVLYTSVIDENDGSAERIVGFDGDGLDKMNAYFNEGNDTAGDILVKLFYEYLLRVTDAGSGVLVRSAIDFVEAGPVEISDGGARAFNLLVMMLSPSHKADGT